MDQDIIFILFVLGLSLIHSVGEAIYKKGSMLLTTEDKSAKRAFMNLSYSQIVILLVIILSIGISLTVKLVYGIVLGIKPLFVTAGLFLGGIAIFSAILGKIIFKEELSTPQIVGVIFIALGVFTLV
ncbi:MAG: hypothetical protein ACW98F_14845 [Candidatus Hodarchaeales archaeon]